jgi:hypothetical protein
VSFPVDTEEGEMAPPIAVAVRSLPAGRPLGSGRAGPGYRDSSWLEVPVGHVPAGGSVAVCLRRLGDGSAELFGGPAVAARTSTVTVGGERRPHDVTLVFLRERPRTTLALIPTMLERATLWRPRPLGPAVLAALLAAVVLGTPVLLGAALRRAYRDGGDGASEAPGA